MAEVIDTDVEHIPSDTTFQSLGIDDWLVQALSAMSIQRPTPIQAACIGPVLDGSSPLITTLKSRTGLHWRSQDRLRKDYSVRCAYITEMVTGSLWNICSCSYADSVL